jgi:hypothetical protein
MQYMLPPNAQTMLGIRQFPQQQPMQAPPGPPTQPAPPAPGQQPPQPQTQPPPPQQGGGAPGMVDPRFMRGLLSPAGGMGQMAPQPQANPNMQAFQQSLQQQLARPQLMQQFTPNQAWFDRQQPGSLMNWQRGNPNTYAAPQFGYQKLNWQQYIDDNKRQADAIAAAKQAAAQPAASAQAAVAGVSQLTPEQLAMLNMTDQERQWRRALGNNYFVGGSANGDSGNGGPGGVGSASTAGDTGTDSGAW